MMDKGEKQNVIAGARQELEVYRGELAYSWRNFRGELHRSFGMSNPAHS